MDRLQEKMEKILAIEDSHEAYIAIATDRELSMDDMEKIVEKYTEVHNVDDWEMAFYPDGERVLTPDLFW